MNTRVCKRCEENKPKNGFHGAICKDCRFLQRKSARIKTNIKTENKRNLPRTLPKTSMQIYDLLSSMESIVVSGEHNEDYDEIIVKMHDLFDLIERAKNKTIAFSFNMTPETQTFLQRVHEGEGDIASAENMLRRNISTNKSTFLKTFGLNPETIDSVYDEVIKIKDSMDAVEAAYNVMVSKKNKEMSTLMKYVGTVDENRKISKAMSNFDLRKNEILIEPNELQLDETNFKKQLTTLLDENNFIIRGFNSCGGFDFILVQD